MDSLDELLDELELLRDLDLDGDLLEVLTVGEGDLDLDRDFAFFFVLCCSVLLSLFSLGAVEYPVSLVWLVYLVVDGS